MDEKTWQCDEDPDDTLSVGPDDEDCVAVYMTAHYRSGVVFLTRENARELRDWLNAWLM